ncbi:MAG: winged helix-turn-helix transcriptional regulator [archaeon]
MFSVRHSQERHSETLAKEITAFIGKKRLNTEEDIIVAVGDDNFILEVVRDAKSRPVLGVSSAASFFAEANGANYRDRLTSISKGNFSVQESIRIEAQIGNKTSPPALNDIGIFPNRSAKLMHYTLMVDGFPYQQDSSDGMVIATPVGSTGYSLSAGGPTVFEGSGVLVATPISSLNKHPSIVVPKDSVLKVSDIRAKSPVVVIDGAIRLPMSVDTVTIRQHDHPARIIKFSKDPDTRKRLRRRNIRADTSLLKGLSPASKLVYATLTREQSLTQADIVQATFLPERTVRYALSKLLEKGLIEARQNLRDARQMLYETV